jgi:DNA modification methylase
MSAGSAKNEVVLDPFFGSGTVGIVATRLMRKYVGIELNPDYVTLAEKRIREMA